MSRYSEPEIPMQQSGWCIVDEKDEKYTMQNTLCVGMSIRTEVH